MKLALCSIGEELTSTLDERFGRANYFLLYNTGNNEKNAIKNNAKNAAGGAGVLAVQQLVDNEVEILIAPEVGPQALDALNKLKIPVYCQGSAATFGEAVAAWKKDELKEIKKSGNKGLHKV